MEGCLPISNLTFFGISMTSIFLSAIIWFKTIGYFEKRKEKETPQDIQ